MRYQDEHNYVEDSGKPGLSATMVFRFIIGTPDSEIAGAASGARLISERVLGKRGVEDYKTVVECIKHAMHIGPTSYTRSRFGISSIFKDVQFTDLTKMVAVYCKLNSQWK